MTGGGQVLKRILQPFSIGTSSLYLRSAYWHRLA